MWGPPLTMRNMAALFVFSTLPMLTSQAPPKNLSFVFVAGVEGAGHHGVAHHLLQRLVVEVTWSELHGVMFEDKGTPEIPREHRRIDLEEDPFRANPFLLDPGYKLAWQSLPSGRSMSVLQRYELLYKRLDCFGDWFTITAPRPRHPPTDKTNYSCLHGSSVWKSLQVLKSKLRQLPRQVYVDQVFNQASVAHGWSPVRVLILWRDFVNAVISHGHWDGES